MYEFGEKQFLKNLVKVATEYGRTKNATQLAEEFKVSNGTVYSWAANLRAVGVDVPKMSKTGIYLTAAKEIGLRHPELLKGK